MDEIIEYLTKSIQDPVGSGLLAPAVFLCFVVALLLVWLLTRGLRLWYWKVNKQIDTLSNIDRKLQELGDGLSVKPEPEQIEEITEEIEAEPKIKGKKLYTEEELEVLIRE